MKRSTVMNYLVEIAKKNKFLVCIYLLSGILIAFLSNFSANYFQRLIDKFNDGSLAVSNIIIYGFVLAIVCVLDYLDEYPDAARTRHLYRFKIKSIK